MTNYARVIAGVAVDVSTDPANSFHPILAAEFIVVPSGVTRGWKLVDGKWHAPTEEVVVEPAPITNLQPTPPEFLLLLTLLERVSIRAASGTDVVIGEVLRMIDDPRVTFIDLTNPSVIEAIGYLTTTDPQLLTTNRASRVLAGLGVEQGVLPGGL